MTNEIVWKKTIKHLLFEEFSMEEKDDLILKLEKYYLDSILKNYKIWANFDYLNSIIFPALTLSQDKHIKNSSVIFLALFFKYSLRDQPELYFLNKEYCEEFFNNNFTYNIQKYKKPVLFLLTSMFYTCNDMITQEDFDYYQDILTYCEPLKYSEDIFIFITDEYKIKIYYSSKKYTLTREDSKEILEKFINKKITFKTKIFTDMHNAKINKYMEMYKKL